MMQRLSRSAQLVLLGQINLFAGLFVCVLLKPHFLFEANEGGVSNYGVYIETVAPYTLGFGMCGLLTFRAGWLLLRRAAINKASNWLARLLLCFGALYIAVLLTTYPYKLNATFDTVHIVAGIVMLLAEMAAGVGLTLKNRNTCNFILLVILLVGFLLAALTFFGLLHILFVAEIVTSLAFGLLLIRFVRATAA